MFVLNKHTSFNFHALLSVDLITVKLVGELIAPLHYGCRAGILTMVREPGHI